MDLVTPPGFQFKVLRTKDQLGRELDEGLMIEKINKNPRFGVLNSKAEWGGGTLTRLSVEETDWEIKKRAKQLIEQEEIELVMRRTLKEQS